MSESISIDIGIYDFFNLFFKVIKKTPPVTYKITLFIIKSFDFPNKSIVEKYFNNNKKILNKWKKIPKNFYSNEYNHIIPYCYKILNQHKYPAYFR